MILKRLFRKAPPPAQPDPLTLAEAALNNSDAAAQRRACRMVEDPRVLRQAAEESPDAGTRDLAAARYRHLLCGLASDAPGLAQALAEVAMLRDPEQLGEIALEARAAELRLAAIEQLPANAPVLARCAVEDALPAHRHRALERIGERPLLEQVVRQIGKKDTKGYRLARERLRLLTQQEERPRLARQRGAELHAQLEQLARHPHWPRDRARLTLLEQQWTEIEADLEPAERDGFRQLQATLLADYARHSQETAQADAKNQERLDTLARRRELVRQLQALAHASDAARLEAELARIGEDWSALDGEQPSGAPDPWQRTAANTRAPTHAPANAAVDVDSALKADATPEDKDLRELREAGQRALEQALARQRQIGQQRPSTPISRATQPLAETVRQPEREARLLAQAESMLDGPGPIDNQAARRLRQQLEQLLAADCAPKDGERENGERQDGEQEDNGRTRIATLLETLERRLGKQRRHAERKLAAAPEQIALLATHLEAGELRQAESLHQKIAAALDQARAAGLARAEINQIDKTLKQHQTQLRELQRWRRWSADQGRESLCRQAEHLATQASTDAADSQLEALAARLNNLRRDWRRICQSGTPAGESYWQRFKQATDQVATRCEPYFQARAERQRASRAARLSLCEQLEHFLAAVDWDSVDWKAMVRAEREMRQAWNALEAPSDHGRDGLEGRFRRGLGRVDKALKEERARNQAHKRDLIARMRALVELEDLDEAIRQAKSLQQQWHTTVAGRKQEENNLWHTFRSASDALFARRYRERTARGEELQGNLTQRETLCEQAEALAKGASANLAEDWEQLAGQWRASLDLPLPRPAKQQLEQRWNKAARAIEQRLRALRDWADWNALESLKRQSAFLSRQAQAILATASAAIPEPAEPEQLPEQLKADWAALGASVGASVGAPLGAKPRATLEARFAAILAALDDPTARQQLAEHCATARREREEICLRLEILAHLDSPPELTARRMEVQVERLRESLGEGDRQTDPLAQSKPLLIDWHLATPTTLDTPLEARFARIEAALKPQPTPAEPKPA